MRGWPSSLMAILSWLLGSNVMTFSGDTVEAIICVLLLSPLFKKSMANFSEFEGNLASTITDLWFSDGS
jgi:hypothetical protein